MVILLLIWPFLYIFGVFLFYLISSEQALVSRSLLARLVIVKVLVHSVLNVLALSGIIRNGP
jgi:hypothetical protein